MEYLFINAFNVSQTASFLVLAIIIYRLLSKNSPKWVSVLLWGMVGLRLLIPFSIESTLSLIPSKTTIPDTITHDRYPAVNTGIGTIDELVNPILSGSMEAHPEYSVNPMSLLITVLGWIWLGVMMCMFLYMTASFIYLRIKTRVKIKGEENVYFSDHVKTPFILGVFRPNIYLPSDISDKDYSLVLAHERAHLKRLDHIWKPLGFLILSVYWFNPLLWVAYILLCRDIESACDEKVLAHLDNEERISYSETLLSLGTKSRIISACPLAFGEVSVKTRIKAIAKYKKPLLAAVIASLAMCLVFAICFLTYKKNTPVAIEYGIWYAEKVIGETGDGATTKGIPHLVFTESSDVLVESRLLQGLSYVRLGTMNTAYVSRKEYDTLLEGMKFREGYDEGLLHENVRTVYRITPSYTSGIEHDEVYLLCTESELYMGTADGEKINALYKMGFNEPQPKYLYTTHYTSEDIVGASLILDTENRTCRIIFGNGVSYEAYGKYDYKNDRFTVTTDDTFALKLVFHNLGDALLFDEGASETKGLSGLFPDGTPFTRRLQLYGVSSATEFTDIDGDSVQELIYINLRDDGLLHYFISKRGASIADKSIPFPKYDHISFEKANDTLYLCCEYSEGDLGVYRYKVVFDGDDLLLSEVIE